LTLKRLLCQF